MRSLLADVRFTLRLVRRSPWFYGALLALLVAGIGAATAMASVVESVLLRPLPYPDAGDLVELDQTDPQGLGGHTSVGTFVDWRAQATGFEGMALESGGGFSLSSAGTLPAPVRVAEVTADFFPLFRLAPLLGRLLDPGDDRPGGPLVAVISAAFWRARFASRPSVLGETVTLNGRPYTVVGVAPPGFGFGSRDFDHVDVWKPLFGSRSGEQAAELEKQRDASFYSVVGRKRRGVSLASAQAQMTAVAKGLELAYPGTNAGVGVRVRDLRDALVGEQGRALWLLFGGVGLVFLVISANVASLLLARARRRRPELATRAALGASPGALAAQIVTETLLLFGAGALGGAALASLLVDALASRLPAGQAITSATAVTVDVPVLVAAAAVSLAIGLAAALGPAMLTARVEPATVLKQTSAGAGEHRSHARVRGLLVVAQLTMALTLLTASALTLRAFARLLDTPAGFDPEGVATAVIDLPERTYDTADRQRAFFDGALRAIAALPGVESASGNAFLPVGDTGFNQSFAIEGAPPWPPGGSPGLDRDIVAPGYFATMRVPLLRGRDFTAADTPTSGRVVILSQSAAARFFPGVDPIGRRITWDDTPPIAWTEIVGIAADVRRNGPGEPPGAEAYTPLAQTPFSTLYVVARTRTPAAVLDALPRLVQRLDPALAVSRPMTMEARLQETLGQPRRMAVVLGAFGAAALLLAGLGLFGLVSYAAAERTRELGIRLALGAPPSAVGGLVVRAGMKLVALGLALGVAPSVWAAREVAGLLPGAAGLDLGAVAPVPVVLALAGLAACLAPAMRAARTPPSSALRYE